MGIFKSVLNIKGAGIQLEFIEASSADDARQKHLRYLDADVYDYEIESEEISEVDSLPDDWRCKSPNVYGVYRG